MKRLLAIGLALLALDPAAAMAAEPSPAPAPKHAWLAGGLNMAGPPIVLAGVAAVAPYSLVAGPGLVVVPFGFGAGHLYTEGPAKAAQISGLGALTVLGTTAIAYGFDAFVLGPIQKAQFDAENARRQAAGEPTSIAFPKAGLGGMLMGGLVGYLAAFTWTTWDAAASAGRANAAAAKAASPAPAP